MKTNNVKPKKIFYHLPPTAVPIQVSDIKSAIEAMKDPEKYYMNFVSALQDTIGTKHCFLVSSGRAALLLILLTIKKRSNRQEVILPAYTCPTVVQAINHAGLQPLFCDVDPITLGFDRDHLKLLLTDKVLSIIPTHLYGLAQEITDLIDVCSNLGIYIIEDAAQAFGALIGGQSVGSGGDFGFFSLGFGKCIPTGEGGIICAKEAYAPDLQKTINESKPNKSSPEIISLCEYLAYGLATTPTGWWIIFRSPWNPAKRKLNVESLPPISFRNLNRVQTGIGSSILKRIDQINNIRKSNAKKLRSVLLKFDFIKIPEIADNVDPVYLRFPFIAADENIADELYQLLSRAGIGVSRSYTYTLPDMFLASTFIHPTQFPGARKLANGLLTLPTHPYMDDKDFSLIKKAFESLKYYLEE